MQLPDNNRAKAPIFSFDGVRAGAVAMLPALPGVIVFSAAFGALAAQKGLTLFETTLMSAIVFAGVSQFVAMEIWGPAITPALIFTIMIATLIVNLRMVLMSATLQPWIAGARPWQVYPSLLLMTDGNWVCSLRYRREGGSDIGHLLGGGGISWLVWVPSTMIGQTFGSLLNDPRQFGIDLVLPLYFVAVLSPMFESSRRAIPWVIAGITAAVVQYLVPGFWFVIAGALAGAIAGGFLGDE